MLLVGGVMSVGKLVRMLRYVEKYLIWFFKPFPVMQGWEHSETESKLNSSC